MLGLGVRAALEGGAVVVGAVGVGAGGLLLGLLGFGAECGLAGGVIAGFAGEHDAAETGLHVVKFGGGDDVFLPRGEDAGDFLLGGFDALWRGRMRGEDFGDGARAALLIGLDALKESDVGVRVVAGLVHVLEAEEVGFALGVAAELQIGDRNGEVEALIDAVASPAAGAEKD